MLEELKIEKNIGFNQKRTVPIAIVRYIHAIATRGPFLNSPLAPRVEFCLLGGIFTPSFTSKGEHYQLFRRMEGRTVNFTPRGLLHPHPGDNIHPQGTIFTPGGPLCPWG
jgi:hypothetical protein